MKKEKRNYKIVRDGNRLFFTYANKKVELGSGLSDDISVFREGDEFVVLSTNRSLEYAGVYIIVIYDNSLVIDAEIFAQNTSEFQEDFFDNTSIEQAKILYEAI